MKATIINCTLKPSPEESNTEALLKVLIEALESHDVECELIRAVDLTLKPGVETDMGEGDDWPGVHKEILDSEIIVIGTPTWLGRPSSVAYRVLERMDAMLSETDDEERPVAYNRVAGAVITGNEDGAHHCITEITGQLHDIGYTIPGQAFTYWNKGPGPRRRVPRDRRGPRLVGKDRQSRSPKPRRRRPRARREPAGALRPSRRSNRRSDVPASGRLYTMAALASLAGNPFGPVAA